ncbi:MAG: multiheme c-type cytochrome, partial [Gammaproteobacteria bacterium]
MFRLNIFFALRSVLCVVLLLLPMLALSGAPGPAENSIFDGSPNGEPWLIAQVGDLLNEDLGDSDSLLLDDKDKEQDLLLEQPDKSKTSEPAAIDEGKTSADDVVQQGNKAHEELLLDNRFPSAAECRKCHEDHYREWSVSPHAYAQLSPVFNSMSATLVQRTNGTQGDFCIRCHTPVGMILEEPVFLANSKRHPTSREGITCIVCHRVNEDYGRISSRIEIVEGSIFDKVYGPKGNA